MKKVLNPFNLFSLTVMVISTFLTLNAIAAESNKIHILQNLDEASLKKVMLVLKQRGYVPTKKPIFSESDSTVVFTRTEANEVDKASIQFEIVMKKDKALPKTIFAYKSDTDKVEDVLNALPGPEQLKTYKLGKN